MSVSIIPSLVSLPESPFPPLAVGSWVSGLAILSMARRSFSAIRPAMTALTSPPACGGIWMPGFMQFIAGVYLFLGLTLFGTFRTPSLYMAALAFTSYGVHWFALGWNRLRGTDPRVNVGMTIAFPSVCVSRPPKLLADIVAMTTYALANSSRNSGTLVVRASMARRPGNGDRRIARTWNATSPANTTSPITSIVTAAQAEEWFRGST
jgi:hypothetical protein